VSLLYFVSSVFCFCICFILLLRGPVFLTTPSRDKEAEGQNTKVGNAETESNGSKGKGEQETLIEMVRILKMEVQSYK
jgi:hypothetical protein